MHVAVPVAEHLDLDMARLVTNFSMKMRSSPKEDLASFFERLETLARLGVVPGDAHALAAAAGRRLDHHRIADRGGDLHRLVGIADQAHMAGHGGDAGFGGELLRSDLVAHRLDGADRRADEGDAGLFQRLGEFGAFRQEAIARMHRLGARLRARRR